MSKTLRNTLKYLLFFGIGIGLMWWAYKDVNLDDIKTSLSHAHWGWIVIALILNYSATALRGLRWNTLLQPLGYKADPWTCVHSVAFGYLMNDLIPRSGEVARCTLLNRAEKIPVDKLIGTVILERIVDVIMLGMVILLTVFVNNEQIQHLFARIDGGKGMLLIYVLVGGILAMAIGIFILYAMRRIPFILRINEFLLGIWNGLKSVMLLKRKAAFMAYTLGIWVTWLLMTQSMMYALEETVDVPLKGSLLLMVAASLGMIIPTQGGLGAYHYTTMLGFIAIGYANAEDPTTSSIGLTFAMISWTGKTILELVMGTIGFLVVTGIKMKKKSISAS